MSRFFAFRWSAPKLAPNSILVVATASPVFEAADAMALLDDDHQENLHPDRILFVAPAYCRQRYLKELKDWLSSKTTLRIDPARVSIHLATFDGRGLSTGDLAHVSGPVTAWPANAFDLAKAAGVLSIFTKRKVLIRPGPGMHFVHPKGVHSQSFLRGANALVNGAEIGFLAMTLLKHLPDDAPRIWVDTSSIASLALAMIALRLQTDPSFVPPHVESFSSYEGLETTKLVHAATSLFLISATASGTMAREIMRKEGIGKDRVVTLFSGAAPAEDITVHCDVHAHPEVRPEGGESRLKVVPAADCPWCREQSSVLRFVSDQFLADEVRHVPVLIAESDAPDGLAELAERRVRRRFFGLTRSERTARHRFWVDPTIVAEEEARKDELERAAARFMPLATTHVVHLEDPASEAMARRIVETAKAHGRGCGLVRAGDVRKLDASAKAVVVAAACIGSGNRLQVVSRDLRDVLEDRPRAYLIGFAKQGEAGRAATLRSDLAHCKLHKHEVVMLEAMTLPVGELDAWAKEEELLVELGEHGRWGEAAAFIERRLEEVRAGRIGADLKLFLPSPLGASLKLSAGFAFFVEGAEVDGVTHADVLAVIAAVLHDMRTRPRKRGEPPRLSATTSHISVLAPGVFGRYNDGVIQAALLRAALPRELNYGNRSDLSAAMLRVVQRSLECWQASQGEACPEFLTALATRRMILSDPDRAALGRTTFDVPPPAHIRMLLDAATRISVPDAPSRSGRAAFDNGVSAVEGRDAPAAGERPDDP